MVTLAGTVVFETPGGGIRHVTVHKGIRAVYGLVEDLDNPNPAGRLEWFDRLQKRKLGQRGR